MRRAALSRNKLVKSLLGRVAGRVGGVGGHVAGLVGDVGGRVAQVRSGGFDRVGGIFEIVRGSGRGVGLVGGGVVGGAVALARGEAERGNSDEGESDL